MSTTTSKQQKSRGNKRKRRYIRPDIQIKVILCILFSTSAVLLFNFQIPLVTLYFSNTIMEPVQHILLRVLMAGFGFSLVIAALISIWAGIVISFHFCGPLHRIKMHLNQLLAGRWDGNCTLRKNDDLKDIAKALNEFVSSSNMFHEQQHRLLQESVNLLDQVESASVDSDKLQEL